MYSLLILAILQNHIEAARDRDNKLLQLSMRVSATLRATRYIVEVVHPLNLEWNMMPTFDKRQIPARIRDLGQINNCTKVNGCSRHSTNLTCRAGLPHTRLRGATFLVSTAPAPTIAPCPITRPGKITAPAPMDAPFSMVVCKKAPGKCLLLGNLSFVKVTLGPMKTSSPTRRPSHNCTPLLTVTRSPMMTSFSIKTWAQILHSAPILAPGRITANCHILVPRPIVSDAASASL